MNGSFYTAITGAKSHQVAIDGTANNIANINTTGYKASITEFSTLFEKFLAVNADTQTSNQGIGVRVGATAINMKSGVYAATDNLFDIAIDGNGWFSVAARNALDGKEVAYTRNGSFGVDRDGMLVNQNGNYVLGSSYGNFSLVDGAWRIDPEKKAGGINPTQNRLFIPDDLIYPAVTTTTAKLNGNILAGYGANTQAANKGSSFYALYDRNGSPMNIQEGQNLLITTSKESFTAEGGEVVLTKSVDGVSGSPLEFTLNGVAISVALDPSFTNAQKAEAIRDAINASNIATASSNGDTLTIRSSHFSIRSNEHFLQNSEASLLTFDSSIKTLEDFRSRVAEVINRSYPNAEVGITTGGSIQINSIDKVMVNFLNGGNSNNALLFALEAINGVEHTKLTASEIRASLTKTAQNIISPEGKPLILESTIKEITPATSTSGATFEVNTKIREERTAGLLTDLSDIVVDGKPLDLIGGESAFIAFGKQPTVIGNKLAYSFRLGDLPLIGNPTFSLEIDGNTISHSASGVTIEQFRSDVANLIRSNGYEVVTDGANISVVANNGKINVANGATNLEGSEVVAMSAIEMTYQKAKTVEELTHELEETARRLSLVTSFANGQFTLTNNGFEPIQSFVVDPWQTPFGKVLANLNGVVEPNARIYSRTLTSQDVISDSQPKYISFDSNGKVLGDTTFVLNNGGKDLVVDLDLTSFSTHATNIATTANGVHQGKFDGYTVSKNGEIIATFNNARTATIAQLPIYHFQNDQGLMRIGDTLFMESENSGQPHFWLDSDGNYMTGAVVHSNMLEGSNVQGAIALTDLIIYQRAYEGNAKSITTSDELIKNAINMKR